MYLADKDGGTELTLTHELQPTDTAVEMHTIGWTGSFDCLAIELKIQPD